MCAVQRCSSRFSLSLFLSIILCFFHSLSPSRCCTVPLQPLTHPMDWLLVILCTHSSINHYKTIDFSRFYFPLFSFLRGFPLHFAFYFLSLSSALYSRLFLWWGVFFLLHIKISDSFIGNDDGALMIILTANSFSNSILNNTCTR